MALVGGGGGGSGGGHRGITLSLELKIPDGSSRWCSGKESAFQSRRCKRHVFDPWIGKTLAAGNGNPLQYSFLENPMDKGTWWTRVHGVAKSQIRLSMYTRMHTQRYLILYIYIYIYLYISDAL